MPRLRTDVLSAHIDALSWEQALSSIVDWATQRRSCYVCICNVHSVVTARREPWFRQIVDGAAMAAPDGMPIVWVLRSRGFRKQQRINGPDLMWRFCEMATRKGIPVAFYGGTQRTLDSLVERLRRCFPGISIVEAISPPFRALSAEEDEELVHRLNRSDPRVVFVGLGCPRQERWMAEHRERVDAVTIGVGAAFDYHAQTVRRAPVWMQNAGLEWLHRLASEPKRLWRRYLVTNVLFIAYMLTSAIGRRKSDANYVNGVGATNRSVSDEE